MANKKIEISNTKWNRYQDILQQINTENAMKEEVRQFESTQKFQEEQNRLNREFEADQNRIDREFEAKENQLDREHAKALQEAKTKADKEAADLAYQRQKEILDQEHKNDIALLEKEYALKQQSVSYSGSSGSTYNAALRAKYEKEAKNPTVKYSQPSNKNSTFTGTSYKEATAYLKAHGVDSSSIMTESEWSRRRNSYSMTGQAADDVKGFSNYTDYVRSKVDYLIANK
jgi:hypothetical protein